MMTEEQKQDLAAECRRTIVDAEKPGAGYRTVARGEIARIALAALTQPASPALKLPEVPPNALVALCEQMYDHRSTGVTVAHDVWQDCIEELRIDVPHTAPIEPICATGGWPDPLLHPAIIALKNGEIHAPEVLDIFDAMAREIQVHRDYKRWDYAPKCSAGGAEWVKCSERMPKGEIEVLLCMGGGFVLNAVYVYDGGADEFLDYQGIWDPVNASLISHWAAKPAAPTS